MNTLTLGVKLARELKSTVIGKSFQQLTTHSLKNFDRTSAKQHFFHNSNQRPTENVKGSFPAGINTLTFVMIKLFSGTVVVGRRRRTSFIGLKKPVVKLAIPTDKFITPLSST